MERSARRVQASSGRASRARTNIRHASPPAITRSARLNSQVRVAAHGRQALRSLADDGPVDIVLTDLVMPEMNGRDLVLALRERLPIPKIICMSGYAEQREKSADATQGLPFVQKPFSLDELGATVRSVLTRS